MLRRPIAAGLVAILVGVLALGSAASVALAMAVGPTAVGNFTYTADSASIPAGADLTAYSGSDANVAIPSTVVLGGNTYNVTSIASHVFQNDTTLVSVTIPDTVLTLGDYTFEGDTALTSIVVPDSVTTLGNNDFQNDTALVTATVGNSVGGLPNSTFQADTALSTLVLGNSVGGIGDFAIAYDTALSSVTFGSGLSGIGNYSFYGDSSLTSVVFPPSLVGLGADAFVGAPALDHVEFLGAAPGYITAAGADASLGTAAGLLVYYPWAFAVPQASGGFTPSWKGYNTVELATVTFDLKGHGSAIAAQKIAVGDSATAPAPSASGLIFNGWYTDSALTTKANFSDPVTADATLFASWSALAVTGQSINPWRLPGGIALLAIGLLMCAVYRRAGRGIYRGT